MLSGLLLHQQHAGAALMAGQTWLQFSELGMAFVLSSLIGLEREFRAKSAGLRTHTLVGVAAGCNA